MTKKIFLEPLWKMRGEFKYYIQNPPSGYEFTIKESSTEKMSKWLSKRDYAYSVLYFLDRLIPIELAKPYWESLKKLPAGTDLTYAILHPVFRKKPWVLDMRLEQAHLMVGSEYIFEKWRFLLKNTLLSNNCKKIIFELESGQTAFLERFKWPELESKVTVVHSGVPAKKFVKQFAKNDRIKLLFVNSANINAATHLQVHGGLVLLEAFSILRQRYQNIELVMRTGMPEQIKAKFSQQSGITIYSEIIPWPLLENEFQTADIFVYPTNVTPSNVFLDAMSYELPVVTTDVWGNPEIVEDGKTGVLIHHPTAYKFTDNFIVHFNSPEFGKAISVPPPGLVESTVEKLTMLIENPELRRRMGKAGRWEIERGNFSIENRNEKLKKILDEATS